MTYPNKTSALSSLDRTPQQPENLLSPSPNFSPERKPDGKSKGLGLRIKTILTAIALGVIPLATIGAISYRVTQSHLVEEINQTQQSRASQLAQMWEKYLLDRINEAETLTANPIFTNPNVMETVTESQRRETLDSFQDKTNFYDSIVYLDLEGNPLFQSQSELPLTKSYGEQEYFRQAIATKKTTLNELGISSYTGESRVEFAVPVKHAWTREVIGVMRFRIPIQNILPLFEDYVAPAEQWYVINTQGIFFANSLENLNNQPFANYFPQIQKAHTTKEIVTEQVNNPVDPSRQQILNYVPVKIGTVDPDLNLGVAISLDSDVAFAPLKSLKWIYLEGTIATVLLVGLIAGFLANRILQPLLKITAAIDKMSRGKLDTRIKLNRQDELSLLEDGVNNMAEQLGGLLQSQETSARTAELMARIAQSSTSRELQLPFSLFLTEVRSRLKSDRVVFYQFDPQWGGTVIAESVAQEFPRTLGVQFDDPCFAREYVRKYQRGRIQAISDIYNADLTSCHLQQLEPYQVKASLVLPVILEHPANSESEQLVGLLIAHQCSDTRVWSQSDVDYLQQIAYQLAMVLKRYVVHQQEKSQQNDFQQNTAEIIAKMKDISRGNLTSFQEREADSADEISKSFDTVLEHLRQVVGGIKTPSQQISQDLKNNKNDLAEMQSRLKQQANQLALIFAFIDQINGSIVEVSSQAGIASYVVDSVVSDLESEKVNFSHAVAFLSDLEADLRDNRSKIKSLSTASQKMTRAINSIKKINLRASLLASKLSKRIPELDESSLGLKEEIQSIQQSIIATKELESVVSGIEREINQVLGEYQKSQNKVVREKHLVVDADKNLDKIVKTTKNAQQNLLSLVNMTKMQQQTSEKVESLQSELRNTSQSIMVLSDRTNKSLEETCLSAKDLENIVDFFKLEKEFDSPAQSLT